MINLLAMIEAEGEGGDTSAPTITSAATTSVVDGNTLAHALTASNPLVSWSITGGADASLFELSGSTLRFAGNTTHDPDAPADADANNIYVVEVTCERHGLSDSQDISVYVTAAGGWFTVFQITPDNQSGSYGNQNTRQLLIRPFVSGTSAAGKARVTFISGLTNGLAVAKAVIGHGALSGNTYDFTGDQVAMTFSGSPAFSIAANTEIVSDEITFAFGANDDLVIALLHQNTTSWLQGFIDIFGPTGFNQFFMKATATDESMTTDVSGYTFVQYFTAIKRLEIKL